MPTNLDLSNQGQAASLVFSRNGSAVRVTYAVGSGPNSIIDDVGDVVGTNNGDEIVFDLGLGDTFHLSSFRGGTGIDALTIRGRGAYDLAGITGVENYDFANSGIVMPDSVFTDISSGQISINIYSGTLIGGQSFNGSGIAAGHSLRMTISLTSYIPITGGAGDDVFIGNLLAGGGEILHGGLGRDAAFIVGGTQFGNAASPAPLASIDGVEFFQFDNSQANFVMVRDANFVGVTGGLIGVALGQLGGVVDASSLSTGHAVWLIGSSGSETLTGSAGNDVFQFAVGQLTASDHVVGGAGNDVLILEGGLASLAGVSGVEFIALGGGGGVAVTDSVFAGNSGFLGINTIAGGSVDASAVGAGHSLFLIGSSATETLIGGAGDDIFQFAPADLSGVDVVTGGGGHDEILLTSSGAINLGGVSGVEFIRLSSGGANSLTLSDSNLSAVSGLAGVQAGNGGDTLDASSVSLSNLQLYLFGGQGNDTLRGGAEADVLVSGGGNDTLFGGGGSDLFAFAPTGTATVQDFQSGSDQLFFSDALFDLGVNEGGPSAFDRLDASAFSSAAGGVFTNSQQRFAFDASTHQLFYAPQGSASASADVHAIAILVGVTTLTANDLFYGH
jgi:Ca2+-binding RTX toxin-like protein